MLVHGEVGAQRGLEIEVVVHHLFAVHFHPVGVKVGHIPLGIAREILFLGERAPASRPLGHAVQPHEIEL